MTIRIRRPHRAGKTALLRMARQLAAEGKVDEARALIADLPPAVVVVEVNETTPGPARPKRS
jgi:hypothetical protein